MSEDVCARVNNRPADAGGAEAGTSTRGVEEVNSERIIYVDSGLDTWNAALDHFAVNAPKERKINNDNRKSDGVIALAVAATKAQAAEIARLQAAKEDGDESVTDEIIKKAVAKAYKLRVERDQAQGLGKNVLVRCGEECDGCRPQGIWCTKINERYMRSLNKEREKVVDTFCKFVKPATPTPV